MNKRILHAVAGCVSISLLTGCIDNAYDLSDIDTTTRINVNGLVIPVNIDKVTLDDIITFDENSKIQPVTIGGERFYALTEEGSFSSQPIMINPVKAARPDIPDSGDELDRIPLAAKKKGHRAPSKYAVSYRITEMGEGFSYTSPDVDSSIIELTDASVENLTFSIRLSSRSLNSKLKSTLFSDVRFQLPKGMTCTTTAGTYDPATGIWTVPEYETAGSSAELSITATKIDLAANGAKIDPATHTFTLDGDFRVLSGTVTLDPDVSAGAASGLPEKLDFLAEYNLSPLEISAISGTVEYKYEGLDIDPISLTDIPDFLSCEGTNILLANPQIYISLNNPMADYALNCSAGLTLTSVRPQAPQAIRRLSYTLDDGPIMLGYSGGAAARQQFVLAPSNLNLNVPDGFNASALNFYQYSSLSNVLAVPANEAGYSELPETIEVTFTNPGVPRQRVTNFRLGRELPGIQGEYMLVAPLALKEGSLIIYSEREDGWGSEDLEALTINELTLTATADNLTPLAAEVVAYPIDMEGNRIPGVRVTSNTLEAMTTGAPIEIKLEGTIERLDGVIFEARVHPGSDAALAPQQTITLHKIRAKVSGYYTKEL